MGRPKKIQPAIITTESKSSTMTLPKPKILAESLGVKPEDIEILIDNSEGEGEITIDKGIEGQFSMQDHSEDKPVDKIMEKYLEKVNTISDINELLPYIYKTVLDGCEHVTEFGVRIPTTTYAILAAKPKKLVSYDIGRYDAEVTEVENLCAEIGQDFQFILADILKVEIEETDCVMSDAFHSKSFVEKELRLHAHKVRKFYIFHDWISYGLHGESPYNDETSPYGAGLGIAFAIEPFLKEHPEWVKHLELDFNNGLLILKRIS